MFTRFGIIAVFRVALILAMGSAWAADNKPSEGWIQGTVIGENGKGFGGAEIRLQRVDARKIAAIARTDAGGRYWFKGLPVGAYALTAYVDGAAVSRANVRTPSHGWAKVDFDLRLTAKGGDGVDRMQRDLRTNSSPTLSGGHAGGF
jgi:hypothetical protein